MSEMYFCSMSLKQRDRVALNCVYALTLTRSRLGLILVSFCKFRTEVWLLIDVRKIISTELFKNKWVELNPFFVYIDRKN